jgi:hypothetical protein
VNKSNQITSLIFQLEKDGSLILALWKVQEPLSIHSQIFDNRQSQSDFNGHALTQSTFKGSRFPQRFQQTQNHENSTFLSNSDFDQRSPKWNRLEMNLE